MPADERFGQAELDAVRVLVLVDLNVVEAVLVPGQHLGEISKELAGQQQQIVEIDAAAALEGPLITPVGGRREEIEVVFDVFSRVVRTDSLGFPAADPLYEVSRLQRFFRHADFPQRSAGRGLLIAAIVDGKVRRISEQRRFLAQNPHTKRVERRDERPLLPTARQQGRGPLRISRAALLVNVTERIRSGGVPLWISSAARNVITRVLPVPAPARTSSGPPIVRTASRWRSFSSRSRSTSYVVRNCHFSEN